MILPSFKPTQYIDMACRLRCDALLVEREVALIDAKDAVAKAQIEVTTRCLRQAADIYDGLARR